MMDRNPSRFEPGDRPMSTADLAAAGELHVLEEKAAPAAETSYAKRSCRREDEVSEFRRRWDDIQTGFVDKPRRSVEGVDALVVVAM